MHCSICGAACADDLEVCAACGAPLKKSPVSDDTIPLAPITEAVIAHARKKPVKLDIEAILAADPDYLSSQPDNSQPVDDEPETVKTFSGSKPTDASAEPAAQTSVDDASAADEEPADPINPIEVLLLSLCILLGIAIAFMIVLIIWPTLIPTLFYHA